FKLAIGNSVAPAVAFPKRFGGEVVGEHRLLIEADRVVGDGSAAPRAVQRFAVASLVHVRGGGDAFAAGVDFHVQRGGRTMACPVWSPVEVGPGAGGAGRIMAEDAAAGGLEKRAAGGVATGECELMIACQRM